MSVYVLDTETTGHKEGAECIEIAWEKLDNNWLLSTDRPVTHRSFCQRYKPSRPILFGAMNVHHIVEGDLIDCPSSSEARLPTDAEFIIGHNIDYDWKILGSKPVRRICTLALSRSIYPDFDSHSLGAMIYALHPVKNAARSMLRSAHSANADVDFVIWLLHNLLKAMTTVPATWLELWQLSEFARIPTRFTFGKHEGKFISQVDRGYLSWCIKQPDMDEYVKEACRRAL